MFSTQRILLDLVMRQNANVMHAVHQHLSDPEHSPSVILNEMASEGMSNFVEGQAILLELAQQQNEILMNGVKERVGDWPPAQALTELIRRTLDNFIDMQQEYLKIADKQTQSWFEALMAGKPYQSEHLMKAARDGMDTFVKAQKRFLDVIADETLKATGAKHHDNGGTRKMKPAELTELAREATKSFVNAQKKLFDVAGQQMSTNVKTAGRAMELLKFPSVPLAELTREGVQSYVNAQKALMEVVLKPNQAEKHATKPATRSSKKRTPHARPHARKEAVAAGVA